MELSSYFEPQLVQFIDTITKSTNSSKDKSSMLYEARVRMIVAVFHHESSMLFYTNPDGTRVLCIWPMQLQQNSNYTLIMIHHRYSHYQQYMMGMCTLQRAMAKQTKLSGTTVCTPPPTISPCIVSSDTDILGFMGWEFVRLDT